MNAALSATSVDPGLDQLFWTYLTKDKLCYLKNSKSDRQPNTHIAFGFSGISGSSDCGYPPESEQGSGLYMRDILYVFIVILSHHYHPNYSMLSWWLKTEQCKNAPRSLNSHFGHGHGMYIRPNNSFS